MDDHADDLLRRALIDQDAAAAVALGSRGLPLCDTLTSSSTAAATSARSRPTSPTASAAPATRSAPDELLRVPCDLDLAAARDRDEAEELYAEQAGALRDALVGGRHGARGVAGAVRGPGGAPASPSTAGSSSTSACPPTGCCRPRSWRPRSRSWSPPSAAPGRSPRAARRWGSSCAQQDVARVYPLPDDPERCLEDFLEHAAEHARRAGRAARAARRPRSSASSSSRATTSHETG